MDQPSTVQLSVQGVKQSEVLGILRGEASNAAHYLVLDACRHTLQGARGGKGFVPVRQQNGVLVAFAAEPGQTASDIGQGSGPYAAALATELVKPGQSDLIMFHNVRVAVMDKTNGDQVPWTEDGIQRRQRVVFGAEGRPPPQPIPTPIPVARPRDCAQCPEMIPVPLGSVTLGSPSLQQGRDADENERPFLLDRTISISRSLVTRAQWEACHRSGQCSSGLVDDHPATLVTWAEARQFATWLSGVTKRRYRLVTSDEREYVARVLGRTGGVEGLGGPVLEWTADCWPADNFLLRLADVMNGGCAFRIIRGGPRPARKNGARSLARLPEIGFRVVRDE